jgi:hypothetical protein
VTPKVRKGLGQKIKTKKVKRGIGVHIAALILRPQLLLTWQDEVRKASLDLTARGVADWE